MAFRNAPVRSQSQIAARQSSAQLRRLQALQERQLVAERSLKKAIEDSNNEVARVQQRRQAKAEAAEEEMMRLTVSLQQSLQDRHVLEAKLRDLHSGASRLALQRQEKEDAAEALSQEVGSKADELTEGQRRLAAARSDKEQLLCLLSEQQSTLQRLAQEAARDTAEADALQAEAAELRARAASEARDDLDLSRAEMMRRRCLVRRAFCTFRSHVQAIKLEHVRQQRRKMIWLRKTMPGILRTWRRHTQALMRHRRRSAVAARRMREVVLAAWRRALTEARFQCRHAPAADALRRRKLQRYGFLCFRQASAAVRAQEHWPHRRRLLAQLLYHWLQLGAAGAAERLRLDWAAKRAARRRLRGAHHAWKSATAVSALQRRRLGASILLHRRSTWFRQWSQAARRKRLSATPLHFGGTRRWWMRRVFRALRIHNFAVQFNRLRQSRSLRLCFRKLRAWARGLRDLKAKRALREARAARALVMSWLLPAWRQTAAKLAVRRRNHAALRRGFVQRRLRHWHLWSHRRRCVTAWRDRRDSERRLGALELLSGVAKVRGWRRARISALARRRRFQELRTLWGAWMRLLVAAAQRWKVEAEETVQAEAELLLVAQRRAILEENVSFSARMNEELKSELCQAKARLTTEEEAVASIASEWGTLQESVLQRRSELQEELAAALRVPDELRAACRRAEEEASTLARSERLALRRDVALQSALREGAEEAAWRLEVQEREVHRLRRGRQSDLSIQLLSFEDSLDFALSYQGS